jgi:thiamine kinase-like enzyme
LPEIKKFKVEDYLGKGIYSGLVNEGLLEGNLANSIQNFIKKNLSLLKKENKYFVHGDLNLGNIISDKTNIWLIDWELIHLNNFVYDIGYLWAHLWQAKRQFRQNLISIFLKKISGEELKKFKIFFPTVASFLALGGIKFQEGKKAENEIRKKFYSQIFENFSNFEKLIKL